MSLAWHLTGLFGCVLLFCPLSWILAPALFLRRILWSIIIAVGHNVGQPMRVLSLTTAIGFSLPFIYATMAPIIQQSSAASQHWAQTWIVTVVAMRVIAVPSLLIDWSSIKPWEQEIARGATYQNHLDAPNAWLHSLKTISSIFPRVWKVSTAISIAHKSEFQQQWGAVARCSGLLLLHLFLLMGAQQLRQRSHSEQVIYIYIVLVTILGLYTITQSFARSWPLTWKVIHLAFLALIVQFSYTLTTSSVLLSQGMSGFLVISLLISGLAAQQMLYFFARIPRTQPQEAHFGAEQWQFRLISQFAHLGKIAYHQSNIFIFLQLLDLAAAILRITAA